jgi:hypothetical protein
MACPYRPVCSGFKTPNRLSLITTQTRWGEGGRGTEGIWLKSASEGNSGVSLITRKQHCILEDFEYREDTDEYLCPNGKVLGRRAKRVIYNGVIYKRYIADREDCIRCSLKNRCIKGNFVKGRYLGVPVGATPGHLIKETPPK